MISIHYYRLNQSINQFMKSKRTKRATYIAVKYMT